VNIKPIYSVPELAALSGIPKGTLWEMIRDERLGCIRLGLGRKGIFVPISSFRDVFPDVWEAITDAHKFREAAKKLSAEETE
jgi:hypothetical protein